MMCSFLYTLLLDVRAYDLLTTATSLSHACSRLVSAAAASVCVDRQYGTNSHRTYEASTVGNSSRVASRADYSSAHMAGGASDRY